MVAREVELRVNEYQIINQNDQLKFLLSSYASLLASMYAEAVPHRSGRLAAGVRAGMGKHVYKGKSYPVGLVMNTTYYAVWNLTGAGPGKHVNSTGREPKYGPFQGDFTFGKIVKAVQAGGGL